MRKPKIIYVPVTPAGSYVMHLASTTETEAIAKLLIDAKHMPYATWEGFKARGYEIAKLEKIRDP